MKDKLWMQLTYVALWGSIPLYLSLTGVLKRVKHILTRLYQLDEPETISGTQSSPLKI
jgi:hypothetical protein